MDLYYCCDTTNETYYSEMVIAAPDEAEARRLADELENDETHLWTDPASAQFDVIGQAVPDTVADVIVARYQY
ncbi:hypothetical protein [Kribbella sp. NPDC049227]|uniref:hypothetical protein n=1 Tax=Kribbella sp. NPDC049227 TaxID=3364113 RepID=UPI0037222AA1